MPISLKDSIAMKSPERQARIMAEAERMIAEEEIARVIVERVQLRIGEHPGYELETTSHWLASGGAVECAEAIVAKLVKCGALVE